MRAERGTKRRNVTTDAPGSDADRVLERLGIDVADLEAATDEMEAQGLLPHQPRKAILSRPAAELPTAASASSR